MSSENQAINHPSGSSTSTEIYSERRPNFNHRNSSSKRNNVAEASSNYVDISQSVLKPTAQDFVPANYHNGAIRKRPQYYNKYNDSRDNNNWRSRSANEGGKSFNSSSKLKNTYDKYKSNLEYSNEGYSDNNTDSTNVDYPQYKSNSSRGYKNYSKNSYFYGKPRNNFNDRDGNVDDSRKVYQYSKRTNKSTFDYKNNLHPNEEFTRKDDIPQEKDYTKNVKAGRKKMNAASQRERLVEMINRRKLECLVCCDKIKNTDKVWSCLLCYHIFHLKCVVEWAKSSKIENGWRCPACQNVCSEVPTKYKCYCGKIVEPKHDPSIIPHSCGDMCLRESRKCKHKCNMQCHPGPCPECVIMVSKSCGCGATTQMIKCCTDVKIVCNATCNKLLECGLHRCQQTCHPGECEPCKESLHQECYCSKEGRKVQCCKIYSGEKQYSCNNVCGKLLSCGNHYCQELCHENSCKLCPRDVTVIKTCPCLKTPLKEPRLSCLDPILCCGQLCGKVLSCGQPNAPHVCENRCHEGSCPPCPKTTLVRCRCGRMDKELPCQELTTKADDARCEKKCTKKRSCGKHKCNQLCCIEIEHICPFPCNRLLSCGQHRCERTCHSGHCPPCMESSFDELYCECGANVLYPPIPCGTKPPLCNNPCSRRRPCGHEANHSCHTGPCPPCTVLCKRWCFGHHEQRSAIPCHQENFSCGLPCGRDMVCGKHKCAKPCHDGPCPTPCKQPCTVPRDLCGHPCGKPCHDPPCPESNCKHNVLVTCPCGLQKSTKPCIEVADEFHNIQMAKLNEKMSHLSTNSTVDLSDLMNTSKRPDVLKILECTEECRVLERNRRLAIGLQIRNPDLSQKLTPRYSDFLKQWGKKDPRFCQKVHEKLSELVQLAKMSKQKSRSYSFESMNRDKRHFIHEYCEHFGVESAAYDMEPNRNIVATAVKDKSWLPSMSLMEFLQRENGQRKVPGPVLSRASTGKGETVSLMLPSRIQRTSTPPREMVDIFRS
ncbi:unnamed protein product [Phyllotreta striolata]|uniref:Protein shuttle craft n=1 Tax=Phyllotreta striolata TaxID=444603 RepID=A0A9N9XPK0_PHYSR|nr:unnamed protein product [Phyllotreta striolata]